MLRKKLRWIDTDLDVQTVQNHLEINQSFVYRNNGLNIVFVQWKNEILAFKNRCPHQGKPMDGCWVEENHVVCPVHRFSYHCETGRGAGTYIEKYPIAIKNSKVQVGLEKWSFFGI